MKNNYPLSDLAKDTLQLDLKRYSNMWLVFQDNHGDCKWAFPFLYFSDLQEKTFLNWHHGECIFWHYKLKSIYDDINLLKETSKIIKYNFATVSAMQQNVVLVSKDQEESLRGVLFNAFVDVNLMHIHIEFYVNKTDYPNQTLPSYNLDGKPNHSLLPIMFQQFDPEQLLINTEL